MKAYFIKLVIFITSVLMSVFYVQTCIGRQNTSAISYSWSNQLHMLQIQGGAIYLHQKNIIYNANDTIGTFEEGVGSYDYSPSSSILFSDNTQAHLCAIYMPADHVGIKLLLATPFKLKETVRERSKINSPKALDLTAKILTPALSMEYYPLSSNSQWQPYVGLGVMVAYFDKLKFKAEGVSKNNIISLIESSTDYTAGMMEEVGINYKVDENWSVGVSAVRSQLNSQLNLKYISAVKIDSVNKSLVNWSFMAYRVNVGYRF
ncbi:MAG: hypothetical protein OXC48_06320 [Endozoicomonadaceae bacterium]|nr:hypothetical protein [Endozoicomonadaceae bacterium]